MVSELVCLVEGAIVLCVYYTYNPGVTHAMISLGDRVVVLKRDRKACCYGRKEGRHAVHLLLYLIGHCFGNWKANI